MLSPPHNWSCPIWDLHVYSHVSGLGISNVPQYFYFTFFKQIIRNAISSIDCNPPLLDLFISYRSSRPYSPREESSLHIKKQTSTQMYTEAYSCHIKEKILCRYNDIYIVITTYYAVITTYDGCRYNEILCRYMYNDILSRYNNILSRYNDIRRMLL